METPMKAGNDPASVVAALLYLLYGPLFWAGHLFLVYAPQSVLCAFRITGVASVNPLLIEAVVGAVTVLSALALVLALWLPRTIARLLRAAALLEGESGPFMISVMRLLAALSLAGVLWAGATTLFLEACPQLR
jgi:hypothetical protein